MQNKTIFANNFLIVAVKYLKEKNLYSKCSNTIGNKIAKKKRRKKIELQKNSNKVWQIA